MVLIHRKKYMVDNIDHNEITCKLIQDIINEHKNNIYEINRLYGVILQESLNIDRDRQTTNELYEFIKNDGKLNPESESIIKLDNDSNENNIISKYKEYIPLVMYITPILCCIIYTIFF